MKHIATIAELEALYGKPLAASITKEVPYITDAYRAFIEKAPFMVVATAGPDGTDVSPRGDPAGFVRVIDKKTVLVPDRRGNNRIDSMRNLINDPRISLLFLIPGVNETLRINGRARILVDPERAQTFAVGDKVPVTLIEVTVDSIFYQCPKALIRSKLWSFDAQVPRSALPSSGQILAEITNNQVDAAEYDRTYPDRVRETIY